ncbi:glycosyltransferase family 8 protein [Rhabdothermincola salaria]|uniref:glycosyltransferase family 8 protein n=1 Tax=Rhabdothermincola salaria TaxID=2903142 RepID=UPI001E5A8940|nr:glycosyltransferase family 8 protein [Rhabdothermincola salaria]MCD9622794.1 glycosyltransferase family 8 protein [Rhabdothermincola salaria]
MANGGGQGIHVVTAADEAFVAPLAVLLQSLADTADDQGVEVTVLTSEVDPVEPQALLAPRSAPRLEVRPLPVPDAAVDGVHLPRYLGRPSAWRLLMGSLLPPEVGRVIYLDADTMVRRSLSDLADVDLGGTTLAAVRDPVLPWFGAPGAIAWDELGLDPATPYFNSGVLVIDLDRWRTDHVGERALDLVRRHRLSYGDQCGLNLTLDGAWTPLPPCWNVQAGHLGRRDTLGWVAEPADELEAARTDPALVHFNESHFGRPWAAISTHPYVAEWLDVLASSGLTEWAPPPPPRRRPPGRFRRAAGVLRHG